MTVRKKKSVIAILFIVLSLLISQFQLSAFSSPNPEEKSVSINWQEKIADDLYDTAEKEEDRYMVYLWRKDISSKEIEETLSKRTRFDLSVYESDRFYTDVKPQIVRRVEMVQQRSVVQAVSQQNGTLQQTEELVKQALQMEMDDYLAAKRNVVKHLNVAANETFIDRYVEAESKILLNSTYSSTLILSLTKEEIEAYAKLDDVVGISPYRDVKLMNEQAWIDDQIHYDFETGTKSASFNYGEGYTGTGVKIGVLEAERAVFNPNAPQLRDIVNVSLFLKDNIRANGTPVPKLDPASATLAKEIDAIQHATEVISLIVGQTLSVEHISSSTDFTGVVPDATVYQMPIEFPEDVVTGIEQLVDQYGVSVINFSGGSYYYIPNTDTFDDSKNVSYMEFDRMVDKVLANINVTFVNSAGNGDDSVKSVTSPGKGYNVITVGNAETKHYRLTSPLQYPYNMRDNSSWNETDFLTNKPDIVAPGTAIKFPKVNENGWVSIGTELASGTSYSAPIVTGVIAQMHQANPTLKSNPVATKAALLAGADFDAIADSTTDSLCGGTTAFREKSGVGLVNAINAVRIAENGTFAQNITDLSLGSELSATWEDVYVTIPGNSRVRIVLTYSMPEIDPDLINGDESDMFSNDLDLHLYSEDFALIDESASPYNNVEIIDCVVEEGGTYLMTTYYFFLLDYDVSLNMVEAIAWHIEPNT